MTSGAVWRTRRAGQAGDPFDFAQGWLFAPPEKAAALRMTPTGEVHAAFSN